MFHSAALILVLNAAIILAHPGHSDVLSTRELHALGKRQEDLLKCRNVLQARSNTRARTIMAKREELNPSLNRRSLNIARQASSLSSVALPTSTASAAPASTTTQASDGACALNPAQEEGPYYVPGEAIRSDLTDGEPGVPFYANFSLIDTTTCAPLVNAAIDIWSCNSTGEYAGFISSDSTNYNTSEFSGLTAHLGDQNDGGSTITDSKTFLRGQQLTDENGSVMFKTIVPGWYAGRAPHVHIRVHVGGEVTDNGTYIGGNLTHTGQTFFGNDFYSQVMTLSPYTEDENDFTTNDEDRPWSQQNGTYAAWNLYYVDENDITAGVLGFVNLGIDSTAVNQTGTGGSLPGGGAPSGSGSLIPPTGSASGIAPSSSA